MRKATAVVVWALLLVPGSAFATDRSALVQAAFHAFCPLVSWSLQDESPKNTLGQHRAFLQQIKKLCQSQRITLSFERNFSEFSFLKNEQNRFMGTGLDLHGETTPIYVSLEVLNGPDWISASSSVKPLNLIFQTLMHEFANKIPGIPQGQKDEVARLFAQKLYGYEKVFSSENLSGRFFSLPLTKIENEIAQVARDEIQPSVIVLIEHKGVFTDLTPVLHRQAQGSMAQLRTAYTEANRLALGMMPSLLGALEQQIQLQLVDLIQGLRFQMSEQLRQQGRDPRELDRFSFSDFQNHINNLIQALKASPREMRNLELESIHFEPIEAFETWFIVHGKLALNRANRDPVKQTQDLGLPHLDFNFSGGLDEKKIVEVPVVFRGRVLHGADGKLAIENLSTDLRPDLDFERTAEVRQISRSGEVVQNLRLRLSASEVPQSAHLRLAHGSQFIFVQASRVETVRPGQVEMEFATNSLNPELGVQLWADSILLNQTQSVLLDRMIKINEPNKIEPTLNNEKAPALLYPALVVRDLNNQLHVESKFHPLLVLALINSKWRDFFMQKGFQDDMKGVKWVDISGLEVRFAVPGAPRLREVRLQVIRDVLIGTPKENEPSRSGKIEIDGHRIPVLDNVSHSYQEQHNETLVFSPEEIALRPAGETTVVTLKKALFFKPISRPLNTNEFYGPPMLRPLKLDVILDDSKLTTLSHTFELIDLGACEDLLNPKT